MSVLDAFFSKGAFKAARCKTLLKLTIPRIKLLRNRRENQLKQMRRDIAKLLGSGQEATARIRVEHVIREENMMAAQEILELFCELIAVRLPIIEIQRECPLDLKEAISSVCFAAPRCADLPELQQAQTMFAAKYGRNFSLRPQNCSPIIIELLSIRAPPIEVKLKLLKEIAEEHEVDWDPFESETEFLRPHEDLLEAEKLCSAPEAVPTISSVKCEINMDLQGAVAAANVAAETAERAAAAARLAASLAQVKITELVARTSNVSEMGIRRDPTEVPVGSQSAGASFEVMPSSRRSPTHQAPAAMRRLVAARLFAPIL
ncbi:unnamed protein product [Spirodela intermedia]|uniref:Uncharacterized protein n=1 Tax=Spirodela intermedia TaxID=51605 RepID=A0A7I8J2P5_SPIIN|nr:unnamed protein product [Spirodela intermedia]CAA6664484.1 unnamed protein product [Spirodela intermedia]